MKSKSAAVNRARQFALIIGNSHCATEVRMASQMFLNESGTQENRSKTTVFPLLSCFPYSKNLGFVPSRFEKEMNIFLPVFPASCLPYSIFLVSWFPDSKLRYHAGETYGRMLLRRGGD